MMGGGVISASTSRPPPRPGEAVDPNSGDEYGESSEATSTNRHALDV